MEKQMVPRMLCNWQSNQTFFKFAYAPAGLCKHSLSELVFEVNLRNVISLANKARKKVINLCSVHSYENVFLFLILN